MITRRGFLQGAITCALFAGRGIGEIASASNHDFGVAGADAPPSFAELGVVS